MYMNIGSIDKRCTYLLYPVVNTFFRGLKGVRPCSIRIISVNGIQIGWETPNIYVEFIVEGDCLVFWLYNVEKNCAIESQFINDAHLLETFKTFCNSQ